MMQPAGQTFVFDVVGRERGENAISLNATAGGIAQVGGPLAAGALLAVIGVAGSFFVGGAGLFLSASLLMAIPIAGKMAERMEETSTGADLRAGFAWVWRDAPVRLVMLGCTMAIVILYRRGRRGVIFAVLCARGTIAAATPTLSGRVR